jgi:hypothetical protein
MKPFILHFAETAINETVKFSGIEFSKELNLNVYSLSLRPVIRDFHRDVNNMVLADTQTLKYHEETDKDSSLKNEILNLTDTVTSTRFQVEGTDSDRDFVRSHSFYPTPQNTLYN